MADYWEGEEKKQILILGIGNILWADEGFGVRVVEYLAQHYDFPPQVGVLDGGTQGLYLMSYLENLDTLIIVDAIDFGLPPATVHSVSGDDVPKTMGARKVSLHQTGFQEVLGLLDWRGCMPRSLHLVGVQPVTMEDYGGGLTAEVAAQVPVVAKKVLAFLNSECSVMAIPKQEGTEVFGIPAIAREAYELGRPSEEEACRYGDERFLVRLER